LEDSRTSREIHVAAGVLRDNIGNVLIAQRPAGKSLSGEWEFPGGKLLNGELPLQGLVRELREELGIDVKVARHLMRYPHDYPDQRVHLYVWAIDVWAGAPQGLEGQPLKWLKPSQLIAQGLLPADRPIASLLQTKVAVNETAVERTLR
jgi:8-oxo-dGTP diphosphatase